MYRTIGGENAKAGSSSRKSKKESVNGTFPLFFMYFLVQKTSLSLRLFPFLYQISPPPCTLTFLLYTTIYYTFLFALLFIGPFSSSLILSPYTDAVDPFTTKTPPPVAVPASQASGSYSTSSTKSSIGPIEILIAISEEKRCAICFKLLRNVPICSNMMTGSVKWTNTGWWPWLTCLSTHSQRIFIRRM